MTDDAIKNMGKIELSDDANTLIITNPGGTGRTIELSERLTPGALDEFRKDVLKARKKHPIHAAITKEKDGESLRVGLSKLDLHPGDTVLVHISELTQLSMSERDFRSLLDNLGSRLPPGVGSLLIVGDITLETISEDRMRELGWVRDPQRMQSTDCRGETGSLSLTINQTF